MRDKVVEKLEKVEESKIPAFKVLTQKRKLSLISQDIKKYISSKKGFNYYSVNKNRQERFENQSMLQFKMQETEVRGRLRVNSLDKDELEEYVKLLQDRCDFASIQKKLLVQQSILDFVKVGCDFCKDIVDEEMLSRVAGIKNICEELTNNMSM